MSALSDLTEATAALREELKQALARNEQLRVELKAARQLLEEWKYYKPIELSDRTIVFLNQAGTTYPPRTKL